MELFVKQCQRCILLYGKIAIKPDIICTGKAGFPIAVRGLKRVRLDKSQTAACRRGMPDRRAKAKRPLHSRAARMDK